MAPGVQTEPLKLGLLLFVEGEGGVGQAVKTIREAEKQGWDGICLRGGPRAGAAALQAAAAAATVTERLRLGVEVLPGPTLHPLRLAEDLSMIDIISAGRLEWMLGDSASLNQSDQEEATEIVLKAWAGGPFSHSGRRWSFPSLRCLPTPDQRPSPPIWSAWEGASSEKEGRIGRWFSLDEAFGPAEKEGDLVAVCGRWVPAGVAGGVLRFGPSEGQYADWAALRSGESTPGPKCLYVDLFAGHSVAPSEAIRRGARELFLG